MPSRPRQHAPTRAESFSEEAFTDPRQQSVVVAGTEAATAILPLRGQLSSLIHQRATIAAQVGSFLEAHHLSNVLTAMPGVGIRTAARILTGVMGKDFADAGHLASCAGLGPVTRRSGSSIRGEHAVKGGTRD